MEIPKIKVYSFNHEHSSHFTLFTVNEKQGYAFFKGREGVLTKKLIYEGEIPKDMRILTKVDSKYLKTYMSFTSQRIQTKYRKDSVLLGVATAIRGTCWDTIYDRELYNDEGKIISSMMDNSLPEEVKSYLTMFITNKDRKRMSNYEKDRQIG